jgi:hypothetical protein
MCLNHDINPFSLPNESFAFLNTGMNHKELTKPTDLKSLRLLLYTMETSPLNYEERKKYSRTSL